ncbi:M-phase phosphoprotein 9 isoform X2 [Sinocyclocheilus rhinocerous]|uniref:M-phase phosphoprotein 9 isoform X2 n=1 Tax=Sinocyclocheilus rhinocerous TaxID=307959 RepID=UPI0007B8A414|nr:PREDICTED: M-phase phosphoprotein 9-like isoform X2 [Sinocyclocheilus rhinocerous]
MSTDDSISEDVSSSVALSHDQISANGGKESEASIVSSEDTVSGLPEEERSASRPEGFLQTTEGENGPSTTPACNITNKISFRNLCLRTEEEFSSGRSLPFINPSSIETLRALVQEIQSSGETDPEIWKNCEGRWLHLFQLVEKQYQEQILAQQEQYQCQIQLIQDEIKALVQLQNRQISTQTHSLEPSKNPKPLEDPVENTFTLSTPGPLSPPQLTVHPQESSEEGMVTVLSSGYGTLSTWEHMLETGRPSSTEGRDEALWSPNQQDGSLTPSPIPLTSPLGQNPLSRTNDKLQTTGTVALDAPTDKQRVISQPLTSWAQRQKHRQRKSRTTPNRTSYVEERDRSTAGAGSPKEHTYHLPDRGYSTASTNPLPLKRSDSLVSEASGLSYWKLDESELYRPLPDNFESASFVLMQTPDENRLSLREIYQSKRADPKGHEWDSLINSSTSSPQVLTLDSTVHVKHSDRTSGFTSPSHFSSPSAQVQACPGSSGAPISPDSMALRSHSDTDCMSNASSLSAQQAPDRTSPSPSALRANQANSEDEGSHTATVTVQPRGTSAQEMYRPNRSSPETGGGKLEQMTSLEDPVVLSLLRQKLREKHARHIDDLRAYYEAEISALKEKLDLVNVPLDMEKSNQILLERCQHLERALTEASTRIRELEIKNHLLERQLAEWPERYDAASATVQALQQQLEETKHSSREKDATVTTLKNRLRQLEEAVQNACKEVDEKEARMKKEHKMLQDLLHEYDSLRREYEGAKDKLASTENKLFDANEQMSELKRVISKLETQFLQLQHENLAKTRQSLHGHSQPSGAGLFHHPDLLPSPSQRQRDADVGLRNGAGHSGEQTSGPSSDRTARGWLSPPEREQTQGHSEEPRKRDVPLTPMMKSLLQMEDTKATESRALSKNGCSSSRLARRRPTVAFVESSVRDAVEEWSGAVLRAQRSLSPEGHRSSSLPPREQRAVPLATPTKRDTLLLPLSAKSSPKRCPTENFSTALGHPLPSQEHLQSRFDVPFDRNGISSSLPSHPSPRKRLQFKSSERLEVNPQSSLGSSEPAESSESEEPAVRPSWEEQEAAGEETPLSCEPRIQSLADAERLFDELTQEKQQIEAALSRIPGAGARVTLQSRLDEVGVSPRKGEPRPRVHPHDSETIQHPAIFCQHIAHGCCELP